MEPQDGDGEVMEMARRQRQTDPKDRQAGRTCRTRFLFENLLDDDDGLRDRGPM